MADTTRVYLELGAKRVFACAYDWPGLCRSGRDETGALDHLARAIDRYAPVARAAGFEKPSAHVEVVERVQGSSGTEFGVPHAILESDRQPITPMERQRLATLVDAAWRVFDDVAAKAPAELVKGPRGGGRDRDKIIRHVLEAEAAYGGYIGARGLHAAVSLDAPELKKARDTILSALRTIDDARWPPRYAARRIAWHVLDHAWEMQDRTPPAQIL